jgi:hypothetical protein
LFNPYVSNTRTNPAGYVIFPEIAQFHRPVKLCPSSPKRSRNEVNWDKRIICQSLVCDSLMITMRNLSKNSFIEALEARKDDVYVRILQDVSSLDCIR